MGSGKRFGRKVVEKMEQEVSAGWKTSKPLTTLGIFKKERATSSSLLNRWGIWGHYVSQHEDRGQLISVPRCLSSQEVQTRCGVQAACMCSVNRP